MHSFIRSFIHSDAMYSEYPNFIRIFFCGKRKFAHFSWSIRVERYFNNAFTVQPPNHPPVCLYSIQYMPIFCWHKNPHVNSKPFDLNTKTFSQRKPFLHLSLSNKSSCAMATSQTDCNAAYLDWRCYLKKRSLELRTSHQKEGISTKIIR